MGLLNTSKSYFTSLSNRGVNEATETLEVYSELKDSGQEFGAAKFLVEVYTHFKEAIGRN